MSHFDIYVLFKMEKRVVVNPSYLIFKNVSCTFNAFVNPTSLKILGKIISKKSMGMDRFYTNVVSGGIGLLS